MMTPEQKANLPKSRFVSGDFHSILDQHPDIGTARIIAAWFFDRPNIFDPNSRKKPKPEIIILLAYVLLMIAVCAAFNLR
jgi:hypothetical protein